MKKWNRILLAGLVVAVIGGVVWMAWPEPPEPVYQGKKLSEWLTQAIDGRNEKRIEAKTAVREIGTNALPYLMTMTTVKDSFLKDKLAALLWRQSIIRVRFRWAHDYHDAAIEGLSLIIPALTNRLSVDENETNRWRIVDELEDAGIHMIKMPAINNRNRLPHVRRVFVMDDDDVGDITELCRKALTNALSDKSFSVRSAATNALLRIHAAEARVVKVK